MQNQIKIRFKSRGLDQKKSQSMLFRGATPGSSRYYNKIYKTRQGTKQLHINF